MTLLLSIPILRIKPKWPYLLVGLAFTFSGLILVKFNTGLALEQIQENIFRYSEAYLLAFCGIFSWALHSNLSTLWKGKSEVIPIFLIVSGVIYFTISSLINEPFHSFPLFDIGVLVFVATFANTFYNEGVTKENENLILAFATIAPIVSVLIASLRLAALPGSLLWPGACLLCIGSYLSKKAFPKKGKE